MQGYLKHQLAAFHGGQLALAGHGHAYGGGGGVLQLQLGAHGTAALVQLTRHAHPAGLLGQRHQRGRREDVQRAAAHGLCSVFVRHELALLALDANSQHKKYFLSSIAAPANTFQYLDRIPHFPRRCTCFGGISVIFLFRFCPKRAMIGPKGGVLYERLLEIL